MIYKLNQFNNNNFNYSNPASMDPLNSDNLSHSSISFFAEDRVVWQSRGPEGPNPNIDVQKNLPRELRLSEQFLKENRISTVDNFIKAVKDHPILDSNFKNQIPENLTNENKITAIRAIQRYLNSYKYYEKTTDRNIDGIIGKNTLKAYEKLVEKQYLESSKKERAPLQKSVRQTPIPPVRSPEVQKAKKTQEIQQATQSLENIDKLFSEHYGERIAEVQKEYINSPDQFDVNIPDSFIGTNLRRMLIQNELTNGTELLEHSKALGLNFIDDISNFSHHISPQKLLMNSTFFKSLSKENQDYYTKGDNPFAVFLVQLVETRQRLSNLDKNSEIYKTQLLPEYNQMLETFTAISGLIEGIPAMEWKEPAMFSPDYLKEVKFSDKVKSELDKHYQPLDFFEGDDEDSDITFIALLQHTYQADLNGLQQLGLISIKQKNKDENPIITLETLGERGTWLLEAIHDFPELVKIDHIKNLTEALYDIQKHKDFSKFQNKINQQLLKISNLANKENEKLAYYLYQLFPNHLSGPITNDAALSWLYMSPKQLESVDLSSSRKEGVFEADTVNQSISDPAMRHHLLEKIKTITEAGVAYDLSKLPDELNQLILQGQSTLQADMTLNKERIRDLNNPVKFLATGDIERSLPLTSDQILLIRRGILEQQRLDNLTSLDTAESEQDKADNLLLDPEVDKLLKAKLGANVREGIIKGALAREFVISQSPDGKKQILEVSGGTLDSMYQELLAKKHSPVLGITFKNTPPTTGGFGQEAFVDISTTGLTLGAGLQYKFENQWRVNAKVFGSLSWNFKELLNSGYSVGTGIDIEGNHNRAVQRLISKKDLKLSFGDYAKIRSSETSDTELLELADKEPIIKSIITQIENSLNSRNKQLTSSQANKLKIFYLKGLANNIRTTAAEDTFPIGFSIDLIGSAKTAFIPIPVIGIPIKTGMAMIYDESIALSDKESLQKSDKDNIIKSLSELYAGKYTLFSVESGEFITTTSDGLPQINQAEVLEGIPVTHIETLNKLNSFEEKLGIKFKLITTDSPEKSQADYEFSINDLISEGDKFQQEQLFNMYADPTSGIKLTALGKNRIGIRFNNPNGLPPKYLAITRTTAVKGYGQTRAETFITFTTIPKTHEEIKALPNFTDYIVATPSRTQEVKIHRSPEEVAALNHKLHNEMQQKQSEPSLLLSSNQILEGVSLYTLLTNKPSSSVEISRETKEIAEQITLRLSDQEFLAGLRKALTITNSSGNLVEAQTELLKLLKHYNIIERSEDGKETQLPNELLPYLLATLIPNTFTSIDSISDDKKKLETMKEVTEKVAGSLIRHLMETPPYNKIDGASLNDSQKEQIYQVLISDRLSKINEKSIDFKKDNRHKLEGYATLLTSAARISKYRELRLLQSTPNFAVDILGSPTALDPSKSDQALAIKFLKNLMDPLPESVSTAEEVKTLLTSETTLKFLSAGFKYGSHELPLASALYSGENMNLLTRLYTHINTRDEAELPIILNSLPDSQKAFLNHFKDFITSLRNADNQTEIALKTYPGNKEIGSITVNTETGNLWILPCANETFYNKLALKGILETSSPALGASLTNVNIHTSATTVQKSFDIMAAFNVVGKAVPTKTPPDKRNAPVEVPDSPFK